MAVRRVHGKLAEQGQKVYLLTHTMDDYADDRMRRAHFRLLLDRIRKLEGYRGHLWAAERHKRGQLHHHCALRLDGYWNYREVVQKWSRQYCCSRNGLDIAPPSKGSAAGYVMKAFHYIGKGDKDEKLPFRWWGTSKISRSVNVSDDELPPLLMSVSTKWWPRCAYVSSNWASELCAKATATYEGLRIYARRKRVKSAHRADELLPIQLPGGAHDPPGHR